MSVIDQVRELDEQREQLVKSAHDELLDTVKASLRQLHSLGFHYTLTLASGSSGG